MTVCFVALLVYWLKFELAYTFNKVAYTVLFHHFSLFCCTLCIK